MLNISRALSILARKEGIRIDSSTLSDASRQGRFEHLDDIISFYKDYGLSIRVFSIDSRFAQNTKTVPCVISLKDGRVLCVLDVAEASPEGLVIPVINPDNPAVLEKLPLGDIVKNAEGKALILDQMQGREDMRCFNRTELLKLFKGRSVETSLLWLLSFAVSLFGLAPIIYLQTALDKVVGYGATSTFGILTIITILSLFAVLVLGRLRDEILDCFGSDIENKLMRAIAERTVIAARQNRISKSLTLAAQSAVDRLRNVLINKAARNIFDLSSVIFLTPILFLYNPILATLVVIYCLICLVLNALTAKQSSANRTDLNTTIYERSDQAAHVIDAKKDLLAFDMDVRQNRKWQGAMARACQARSKVSGIDSATMRRGVLFQSGLTVLIIFAGVGMVLAGYFTPGSLIAINLLGAKVLQPLLKIGNLYADLPQIKEDEKKVNAVLSLPREAKTSGLRPGMTGQISLQDVTVNDTQGTQVKNISLELKAGSKTAFLSCDDNSASKIAQALDLTLPLESGQILFDTTNITRIDARHLARRVIRIDGHPFFFAGTIADNLYGIHPNMDPCDIDTIASAMGFLENIQNMPDGLETKINTVGTPLDRTARIQLALIRALSAAPSVLIIDEALDLIPKNMARKIMENIESRIGGASIVLATLRPDIADLFDDIYTVNEAGITSAPHLQTNTEKRKQSS